ncbi:MAG TPA: rhodanese-like domain-containing protein, partial [Ilumatobacteraceae bacterium]
MTPLISADELLARIDDLSLVVCDVRSYLTDPSRGRREYGEAHLPGAVFVDSNDDLADLSQAGRGRHPLPSVDDFVALLRRLGISPGHTVVAYDGSGGANAARLWWMLRSIGHEHVAVLDGGLVAWIDAGGPLTAAVPERRPTEYPVAVRAWRGVVDADDIEGL